MIEKECAKEIVQLSLKAVSVLSEILKISENRCSKETYEKLKKGVGIPIGKIQTDLLDIIALEYPELDDLDK